MVSNLVLRAALFFFFFKPSELFLQGEPDARFPFGVLPGGNSRQLLSVHQCLSDSGVLECLYSLMYVYIFPYWLKKCISRIRVNSLWEKLVKLKTKALVTFP